jgi:hypothetical protein
MLSLLQYAGLRKSPKAWRVRQVQSPYVDQQTYGTTGVGTTARRPGGRHASDPAAEASSIMHTEHALLHALYDSTTDTHLSQQGRVPYAAHESDAAAATVAVVEGSLTSNARALF